MKGILRTAAVVPHLYLANVAKNTEAHIARMREAAEGYCALAVFPELSLTGYTCGDLFYQRSLIEETERAIRVLTDWCPEGLVAVVGAPVLCRSVLYNCAVVLTKGRVLGVVPKTFLPNNSEFYEKRWFHPATDLPEEGAAVLDGIVMRRGPQVFESRDGVRFGV